MDKILDNISYTIEGHFTIKKNNQEFTFDKYTALAIAYAIVDWAGEDYKILDKVLDKVEEVENDN